MALHHLLSCMTVTTILLWRGCHSQQPAGISSRILGGEDAAPGKWPWHAVVVTYGPYGYNQCGGSLITDHWVLTAARCLSSTNYNTVVYLGRYNQSDLSPNEVTRKVEDIVCHPQRPDYYYYSTYENDICLLKLSEPVNSTDNIHPISLASEDSTFYNGTSSWVTGFGYDDNYRYPNILQEVNVPILGNNECRCYFGDYNYYYWFPQITENVTCTWPKYGWKGPCYGDQGEPLMVKNESDWVQIGITSYANCYGPSVYTRVSQYQKWINDTITSTTGTPPKFVTLTSQETDSDLDFTCPTSPPTTIPTFVPDTFSTPEGPPTPESPPAPEGPSDSFSFFLSLEGTLFGSSENLTHFTHFTSLCVIAVLLHLFV